MTQQALRQAIEAMKTLDLEWARRELGRTAQVETESSRNNMLAAMHQLRFECTFLSAEYRHKSREWLENREIGRMYGQPWPAKGVLP